MDTKNDRDPAPAKNRTAVERKSDRDLVVTRTFNGTVRLVYEAWTRPELFKQWWTPKSFGLTMLSCEMDVRVGGTYRLVMRHPSSEQPMAFFGKYIEVTPSRLVWTNDDAGEAGAITTVTFEEKGGETLVVFHDRYPTKAALDEAIASGATSGFGEQFEQLDAFLIA